MELYVLLALLAASFQAFSSVYSKRLHAYTDNPLKVAVYSMFGCAAITSLLLPFVNLSHITLAPGLLALMCGAVVCGHLLFISAVRAGDASFVVPMMGVKMFIVAGLAALLLGETYGPLVYLGAGGAFVGMFFLNDGTLRAPVKAVLLVLGTMSFFGLTDVLLILLLQAGYTALEVMVFMFVLPSLALMPFAAYQFRGDWRISKDFAGSLSLFGLFQMLGGFCLMIAFALSHKATMVNIIQSARGLFAIGVVYLITRSGMAGFETLNRKQYLSRLFGAALMSGSIVLAVLAR
ncbi:MAG: EamA family transporter [Pseudomonadota bacterium]|nr:EamA family transporter [Pseudomonadota bacterium]